MKSLIIPFIIISALILFFAIIDRKEFNRNDDIQTVQGDNNVSKRKSASISTAGTSLSRKANSAVEAKPKNNIFPVAIPVVTPEEAEKINAEALEYAKKKRMEPFYKFYQNSLVETICFEGTVRATSTVPDPEKNDYDDCLYALFVEINSLLSELPPDTKIASEVIVNVPIMKGKTILQDNKLLPGDKIWCRCADYDGMPQDIQEIQVSDDIQSYEHQQYFPFEIRKIAAFQKGGKRNFAKREITVLPIQPLPEDEKAVALRKERIQKEISRIENEIKKHGGSFETWKEEYKSIADKYKQLSSEGYNGWIHDSFYMAGGEETAYSTNKYITSIKPYKEYLEKNNIDLIILRIPSKWDFAARVLASDSFQENPAWIEHYYECLKNDIEIVDPMPEMYMHRYDYPLFYYYHDEKETHPHEGTFYCTAFVLSNVLRRYQFSKSSEQINLASTEHRKDSESFYYPKGNPKYDSSSHIHFRRATINNETVQFLKNTNSPFLFVSNSFIGSKAMEPDLGIPQFVSFFLQTIPDWYYQSGIGNEMLRNLITDSSLLSSRKAVIMGAHPMFWSSFPLFPRYISDNAQKISLEKILGFGTDDINVISNDSFLINKASPNSVIIERKEESNHSDSSILLSFVIPYVETKTTCMIRVPLNKAQISQFYVSDSKTNIQIDSCIITDGLSESNDNADLFVPLEGESRSVTLKVILPNKSYDLRNIELWYY